MPELPEVETVKEILKTQIIGKTIDNIEVLREKTILTGASEFKKALKNQTITNITRKGKFLIFHLTNEIVFLSHLRMEGKYYYYTSQSSHSDYELLRFNFNDGTLLCYDDSRMFGIIMLRNQNNYLTIPPISDLGKEPFDIKDASEIKDKFNVTLPIKSKIMDQNVMSGLGNIYADEVLFMSKIHPLTPSKSLTIKDIENVINNSSRVLKKAIEAGGSTIRSYHPSEGTDGRFQRELLAYGKENEPCSICGTKMKRIMINGRSSTFCPHCQKKIGSPITVAITGPTASGKSHVIKYLASKNYPVLDCDQIVRDIYDDSKVQSKICDMLNLKEFSKIGIREKIKNLSLKEKLQNYIHPLVLKRIEKELKKYNESDIVIVEIQLLFESGYDKYFTYSVYIDLSEELQISNLTKRGDNIESSLKLNSTFKKKENKEKSTYVINNDADLNSLYKKFDELIEKLRIS